jgi:periplasmic protein TonB
VSAVAIDLLARRFPVPPPPDISNSALPPPPLPKIGADGVASARIRAGDLLQTAKLIKKPAPKYPPAAREAYIQGIVKFRAVIGKDGTIQNLTPVSGHPLLVQAALDAVKQWLYQPTLLNGEPVEVLTEIDVNFTLVNSVRRR